MDLEFIKKNKNKIYLIIAIFVFVAFIAMYIWNFRSYTLSSKPADWGVFGDYFGAIFGFASFMAVLYGLYKQHEETREQKENFNTEIVRQKEQFEKEMKHQEKTFALAVEENERQKQYFEDEKKRQKLEKYQDIFFKLLDQKNNIINKLQYKEQNGTIYYGETVFMRFSRGFEKYHKEWLFTNKSDTSKKKNLAKQFSYLFDRMLKISQPYFATIFSISEILNEFKYVGTMTPRECKSYENMVFCPISFDAKYIANIFRFLFHKDEGYYPTDRIKSNFLNIIIENANTDTGFWVTSLKASHKYLY